MKRKLAGIGRGITLALVPIAAAIWMSSGNLWWNIYWHFFFDKQISQIIWDIFAPFILMLMFCAFPTVVAFFSWAALASLSLCVYWTVKRRINRIYGGIMIGLNFAAIWTIGVVFCRLTSQ